MRKFLSILGTTLFFSGLAGAAEPPASEAPVPGPNSVEAKESTDAEDKETTTSDDKSDVDAASKKDEGKKDKSDSKKDKSKKPPPDPWLFYSTSTVLFDTNINHDQTEESSFARIFGLGAVYRRSLKSTDYEVIYEINHHEHTVNRWDRYSHYLRASAERPLSQKWSLEMIAEMNLKGSIDDADLSDEYLLLPRLAYNINKQDRLRFFAVYRLRKYPDQAERDAINRYAGVQFRHKFKGGRALEFGYRYELNNAEGPRYDYLRRTYDVEFTTPLSRRDNLQLEAKLRPRDYDARLVDVGNENVLREDRTWMLTANLVHTLSKHRDLNLYYKYETQGSNDPDKEYGSHLIAVSLIQRW